MHVQVLNAKSEFFYPACVRVWVKIIPILCHPACVRMKFCAVSMKVVLQGVGPCFKNMTSDLRSHKITGSTSGTVTVTSLKDKWKAVL